MLKVMEKGFETVSATPLPTWQNALIEIPEFNRIKEFPTSLKKRAIDEAVNRFVFESKMEGDPVGASRQLLKSIANAVVNAGNSHFWLAESGGDVAGFLLATVTVDIDDRLTYWCSAAWVAPRFRRHPGVLGWWDKVKKEAKRQLCSHIVLVSSRNPFAYRRWLKTNFKNYAVLLMEDI